MLSKLKDAQTGTLTLSMAEFTSVAAFGKRHGLNSQDMSMQSIYLYETNTLIRPKQKTVHHLIEGGGGTVLSAAAKVGNTTKAI